MSKLFFVSLLFATVASAEVPKTPRVAIDVTKRGFEPDNITVAAGKPVTLVFTRRTEQTCTKSVIVTLDDGNKLERELPLDKPVEITTTFPRAGKLAYACSMGMSKGIIVVQ